MTTIEILRKVKEVAGYDCTLKLFESLKGGGNLINFLGNNNIVQEFQSANGLKVYACPDPELIGVYHSDRLTALELSAEELERRLKGAFEQDAELGFDKAFK